MSFMQKMSDMNADNKISVKRDSPPFSEQAFRKLRRDVLVGTFAAGSKLKLDELQEHYRFSSSPSREALSRLSQEGLVRADERRGFRVAPISLQDLNDITRMRLLLDVDGIRSAIELGDDAWEATIVASFHRLEKIESRLGDGPVILNDEWSDAHRAFHISLIAACASERQKEWSSSLFDQAERYRRFSAQHRQVSRRKSSEHRKIMNATLQRDADSACSLISEHILRTQRNVEVAMRRDADQK
jgi:DNA-binding GntR family transcriptional regulator